MAMHIELHLGCFHTKSPIMMPDLDFVSCFTVLKIRYMSIQCLDMLLWAHLFCGHKVFDCTVVLWVR